MQATQERILFTLRAVRAFFDANRPILAPIVASGALRKLDDTIATLEDHAAGQDGHTRSARDAATGTQSLRNALLRDHMLHIARTARVELPDTAETRPLRVLDGRRNDVRIITAARGMAQAAAPHEALFIDSGLPTDFIAQLNAATDALVTSITLRRQVVVQAIAATKGLDEGFPAARRIIHQLDGFVTTALNDDPALLAAWRSVSHVRRSRSTPPAASPARTPAAAPAPAPAPAPSASTAA